VAELRSIEPLRAIIETQPLGVFSDIDGTLAPIVRDPAAAAISPLAKELLERLIARGVRVALVSGREVEVARQIAGVEGAAYAGNHGLHVWLDGRSETTEAVQPYVSQARRVLAEIGDIRYPGVSIEDKGPVLAFHYRNARDEVRPGCAGTPHIVPAAVREGWSSTGSPSRSVTGQDMLLYEVEGRHIGRIGSPEGGQAGCQGQDPLLQQLQYAPFLRCMRQPAGPGYELESEWLEMVGEADIDPQPRIPSVRRVPCCEARPRSPLRQDLWIQDAGALRQAGMDRVQL